MKKTKRKKMDKKKIKEEIDKVVNQIKTNSKDSHFADTLIESLMSLKGQYDVEAVRLCIPEKDVIKEYDFGSYRFVKCSGGIMFQTKGGYTAYFTPRCACIWEYCDNLLELKDRQSEWSEEDKKIYETIFAATFYILAAPVFAPSDDECFFGIATDIMERLQALVDKESKKPLMPETHEENAEFEAKTEMLNEVLKEEEGDVRGA